MVNAVLLVVVTLGSAYRAPPLPGHRQTFFHPPLAPPERHEPRATHHHYHADPGRRVPKHFLTASVGLLGYMLGRKHSEPAPPPDYPYVPDAPEPAPTSGADVFDVPFVSSPYDRDAWCRAMPYLVCPPWYG